MTILLTGAHGVVGTAVTQHSRRDYDLLDRQSPPKKFNDGTDHPHTEKETTHADVSDLDSLSASIQSQDAIVHLAGNSNTDATFEQVLQNNILGTYNALEVARRDNIDTFVFASSNHVVGLYEQEYAPDIYESDCDLIVDHTSPIRPDSHYGSSKAAGEAWGRQYAEEYGIQFYALRIGSVRPPRWNHPYGDAERGVDAGWWEKEDEEYERQVKRLKSTWQSRRDIAHMIECCLDDDTVDFDVFYGISDNSNSWFDIEHAREQIGYEPSDSADEDIYDPSKNME
jgi:nucleoside-diphosphate-sugar epimerase